MRPASLFPHQTSDELELAYRQSERAVERSRWQILWLKSKGLSIPEIKAVTSFSRSTISTLIRAYNKDGPAVVVDRRRWNKSTPALGTSSTQDPPGPRAVPNLAGPSHGRPHPRPFIGSFWVFSLPT
ncbi:helix-turn-helix domain-containing protein [Deinococcus aquatilis]|uniref:helix-turn-helix domain-containing protein n=1 Tax=Deinococcus aquatilis TaxID=519440 RepID=UPI0012FA68E4